MAVIPWPIEQYLLKYPHLKDAQAESSQYVRTTAQSFFSLIRYVLESLPEDTEVWSTDKLRLSSSNEFSNYWFSEGLEYLLLTHTAFLKGISFNRIFIDSQVDYNDYRADIDLISRLHAKCGVTTHIAIYENTPKDCRYDFVVFGNQFVDEVICDLEGDIADNLLHWSYNKTLLFHDKLKTVRNNIRETVYTSSEAEPNHESIKRFANEVRNRLIPILKQRDIPLGKASVQESNEPTSILLMSANPQGDTVPLKLGKEFREIDKAIRLNGSQNGFLINMQPASDINDLQDHLLRFKPHVLHFCGHGDEEGNLVFESNDSVFKLAPHKLVSLLEILKDNLSCVLLNACYSEKVAIPLSKHIDCVIGMGSSISDDAAVRFSTAFYRALGYKRDVYTAFMLGRSEIDLHGIPEDDTPKLHAPNVNPRDVII